LIQSLLYSCSHHLLGVRGRWFARGKVGEDERVRLEVVVVVVRRRMTWCVAGRAS
jgi:hypothetical protein